MRAVTHRLCRSGSEPNSAGMVPLSALSDRSLRDDAQWVSNESNQGAGNHAITRCACGHRYNPGSPTQPASGGDRAHISCRRVRLPKESGMVPCSCGVFSGRYLGTAGSRQRQLLMPRALIISGSADARQRASSMRLGRRRRENWRVEAGRDSGAGGPLTSRPRAWLRCRGCRSMCRWRSRPMCSSRRRSAPRQRPSAARLRAPPSRPSRSC